MSVRKPVLPLFFLLGCRATWSSPAGEIEGATSIGLRNQPSDWENSSVPVVHFDWALLPESWPVGPKLSADVTGWFGSQTGEQTGSLGLGVTRGLELFPDQLRAAVGAGWMWLETDNDELFSYDHDAWQATYLEGGLYFLPGAGALHIGLEVRYAFGDGPDLDGESLGGEFLDVFLVFAFFPEARPTRAPPRSP